MNQFVDTHAHIHFSDYKLDPDKVLADARSQGVATVLVVGCDLESSQQAIEFSQGRDGVFAIVGIHPHEAEAFLAISDGIEQLTAMIESAQSNKIVGIGEFGLDYYYGHSSVEAQKKVLEFQLEMLQKFDLPASFHVRSGANTAAFDDFWEIFDSWSAHGPLKGVLHSFSADEQILRQALGRGLYIALNGIMTFTKDQNQLGAVKAIPLDRLLLETDAPFLTPKPFRGKICTPEHVVLTAEFLAELRRESLEALARQTTANAGQLFDLF